mmetsp:Transcript_13790/g.35547  ORF Transcript_13790/g.35547 Transcript_13790/m.35547 type:complete len:205 (+) Transcript_13790:779-1393(+)
MRRITLRSRPSLSRPDASQMQAHRLGSRARARSIAARRCLAMPSRRPTQGAQQSTAYAAHISPPSCVEAKRTEHWSSLSSDGRSRASMTPTGVAVRIRPSPKKSVPLLKSGCEGVAVCHRPFCHSSGRVPVTMASIASSACDGSAVAATQSCAAVHVAILLAVVLSSGAIAPGLKPPAMRMIGPVSPTALATASSSPNAPFRSR